MLREGEKKIKSALDQTVIFHSSEQAALLVNRKLEIQTKGRGNVRDSIGLRQNSEVGKVWLRDLPVPHSPPPPRRNSLEQGKEKKNLTLPLS